MLQKNSVDVVRAVVQAPAAKVFAKNTFNGVKVIATKVELHTFAVSLDVIKMGWYTHSQKNREGESYAR